MIKTLFVILRQGLFSYINEFLRHIVQVYFTSLIVFKNSSEIEKIAQIDLEYVRFYENIKDDLGNTYSFQK